MKWSSFCAIFLSTLKLGAVKAVQSSSTLSRKDIIEKKLLELSSFHDLEDSTSSQRRAANWLINVDIDSDLNGEHFVQRYVMSVIYFSLIGGTEVQASSKNWLTPESECAWGVLGEITCDDKGDVTQLFFSSGVEPQVDKSVPPEIGRLDKMTSLSIMSLGIGGEIPMELLEARSLRVLNATDNNLWFAPTVTENDPQPIPTENGPVKTRPPRNRALKHLDLSRNKLGGEFPSFLQKNCGNLETLLLTDNELEGSIPGWVGSSLPQLKNLHLSNNKLSGTIPDTLYSLDKLKTLKMDENNLSGTMSKNIGDLRKLQSLYVNHNNLGGEIPVELGRIVGLKEVRVHNTKFEGSIPSSVCDLPLLVDFQTDCHIMEQSSCNGAVGLFCSEEIE